jgi:O-antigen ligase
MVEFLLSLNLGRLLFILILFLTYIVIGIKTKRWFFVTAIFLIFILPFNLTLQLDGLFGLEYIKGIVSNYTIPTLSILDIFVFLLFVLVLKGGILSKFSKMEKFLFILLFFFVLVKTIFDLNVLSTIIVFRLFLYFFTIYSSIRYFFEVEKDRKVFKKVFLLTLLSSVIIQTCIGLLQFLRGQSLDLVFLGESQLVKGMFGSSFVDLGGQLFLRAYGTYPHPNVFAAYLFFALFLCLYFLKNRDVAKFDKKVLLSISILSTFAIFLTLSRIVILLSIFLWLLFFFQSVFQKKNLPSIIPPFILRFSTFENSFTDRIELAKNAIEIFKNYPLLGIGAGRYIYGADYHPVYTSGGFLLLEPVHNVFLLILAEYGLIFGIPLIFGILFLLARAFLRGEFLIKIFVCAILLMASLDHYFFTLPQGIFLFFLGLLGTYLVSSRKHQG